MMSPAAAEDLLTVALEEGTQILDNSASGRSACIREAVKAQMETAVAVIREQLRQGYTLGEVMVAHEMAFATGLAMVAELMAEIHDLDSKPTAATFLENVMAGAAELALDGDDEPDEDDSIGPTAGSA